MDWFLAWQRVGSPPRLRETHTMGKPDISKVRITPAPAGNTSRHFPCITNKQDHPRACGKHFWGGFTSPLVIGSPPRLRETLLPLSIFLSNYRITPAPAGNTKTACSRYLRYWDHPRACGKHWDNWDSIIGITGSPPRLRETQNGMGGQVRLDRITPAPAGNTHQSNDL